MADGAHVATLNALPDEVLQHVLFYLSPQDTVLNLQRVSKRFNRLGNEPLLWRYYCRVQFQYWDSKHRIRHKFLGSVGDVDWKTLYTHRKKVDTQISEILDSILEDQINRIKKFNSIGEFGYDAKDTLLRHCHTGETAEDVLARRYLIYCTSASLHPLTSFIDFMPQLCSTTYTDQRLLLSGQGLLEGKPYLLKERWDRLTCSSCTTIMEISLRYGQDTSSINCARANETLDLWSF